jgi:hypothetical protein
MNIAFLYPLAWLGALAVAVPIWLHLRRREDANLVRFSALRFLEDQPAARTRPLWPHNWPLLLLRLLGLLLLVAAFSWPYLVAREDTIIGESRVYILDNTLSHRAGGGFEQSRGEILRTLENSGLDTQIAVVELKAQPRVIAGFGSSRDDALAKVRALKPSFQRGSYLAAFRVAHRLLDQSLGKSRRIVLLGDNQANQWTEELHATPFLENVEVTLPEKASGDAANVALMEPTVRRTLVGDRAITECAVSLYHQGQPKATTLVVRANGKDVLRREVPLRDQPESMTCLAEWESDPTEWTRGEVRLEGEADALSADDRVVFSLPPVREGRVGLASRSPFLRTALSPEVMRGRWTTRLLTASDSTPPGEDDPRDDVLCIESRYLESSQVRKLVTDALLEGRGAVLVVDQVTAVIEGFLRELGVEAMPDSEQPATTTPFRYVFMEHEIFHPFRSADFGDLTEITVDRYRRLKAPDAVPLIFSEAGDAIFLESEKLKGRLLVLAFSLDRTETNWPLHPTFVPFLDRCLQRARSTWATPTAFLPGESCVWQIAPGQTVPEVVLTALDETNGGETLRAPVEDGQARFQLPDSPGLYALSYGDSNEPESLLAVNPPPKESYLSYTNSPPALQAWTCERGEQETAYASGLLAVELSEWEILRQRFWWWLVLGGLAALITETLWLSMRRGQA